MADIVVKRFHKSCPLCDCTHEVEERLRMTTAVIKGEEVTYEERFYFCANAEESENEYETAAMMNENLLRARNAYRKKLGLLTSEEIIEIRERYGLSQVDLARLLGWGEATIARYESKAIQEGAYDAMLRLIRDNPLCALDFLKKNKERFTEDKYLSIREKMMEQLDCYGKEFLTRQSLEGEYADFDVPSDSNGFTVLDIDKLETVISYFAERMDALYKTKLMKLLWYADVLCFIQTGRAMTGLVYRHEKRGALPVGHYRLMSLENLTVREEIHDGKEMFHIYPSEQTDCTLLTGEETEVLERVVKKFKTYRATDIVDYMHGESAYQRTALGEIIPFHLAKEIRAF